MDEDQHRIFTECTQRTDRPSTPANEAWLVCGRRAGKSFILAVVAVFLACSRDWLPYLGIGERGTIMVIAADSRQARTILRYVKGLLQLVPMLTRMIEAERQEAVDLNNRISIEVHTASFKTTRGYTIVAALLDEIAFWPTDPDSADPDGEVVSAIKPAMATIPNAMLLCASSPYARRGALWESVPPLLRADWWAADLASINAHDEPDRAAEFHRRRIREGCGFGGSGVWGAV